MFIAAKLSASEVTRMPDKSRQPHREKKLPPCHTHTHTHPFPNSQTKSWWLNQANSAVQDGRGRKRMEEGRNEP